LKRSRVRRLVSLTRHCRMQMTGARLPNVFSRHALECTGRLMASMKPGALRVVALVALLAAPYGVYYTLSHLAVTYSEPPGEDTPYFLEAYYSMVTVCLIFYALLAFFGMQFWRLNTRLRFWFLSLLIIEVAYVFLLGFLWGLEDQEIAMSIAAATGVANGGLVAQGITLFPIWAGIIVFLAHSKGSASGRESA
jgi:hypothetical protein